MECRDRKEQAEIKVFLENRVLLVLKGTSVIKENLAIRVNTVRKVRKAAVRWVNKVLLVNKVFSATRVSAVCKVNKAVVPWVDRDPLVNKVFSVAKVNAVCKVRKVAAQWANRVRLVCRATLAIKAVLENKELMASKA